MLALGDCFARLRAFEPEPSRTQGEFGESFLEFTNAARSAGNFTSGLGQEQGAVTPRNR